MTLTLDMIRAAYDALGLDHDLTLGVTITPGHVHVTTAALDDNGSPIVEAGVLQRTETSHSVTD